MQFTGDKKSNITAAFGSDIMLEGITGIPNLLLKYYTRLGISDSEMMLIIQMLYLRTAAQKLFPTDQELSEVMSQDKEKIKAILAGLIERGIIGIAHCYSEELEDIVSVYSYEPLYEKISEIWACEKVNNFQQMKKLLKQQSQKEKTAQDIDSNKVFAKVCKVFEKEFARLLSPMEIEKIGEWVDEFAGDPELILEALKRAVMLGKHNFKYIDSILLEWYKNNLRSVAQVQSYEANFRERQVKQTRKKPEDPVSVKKKDKFRLLYSG